MEEPVRLVLGERELEGGDAKWSAAEPPGYPPSQCRSTSSHSAESHCLDLAARILKRHVDVERCPSQLKARHEFGGSARYGVGLQRDGPLSRYGSTQAAPGG